MDDKFIPIIGLEVHVELKTASKMFCRCKNDPFHAPKPNIYTCPVCLGLPGALPVPNRKAIEWTVKLGLALHCQINEESKFDRKHYFYPDLPKGYQISQYDCPLAASGAIEIREKSSEFSNSKGSDLSTRSDPSPRKSERKIRIRRVHLEEDTGKLLHRKIDGEEVSLIDFNRSGVPLMEIVTEPDIHSPEEAKAVAKKIYDMVRFLEISDADMEKGSMRIEANVSLLKDLALPQGQALKHRASRLPDYKVELKNINSFRFLERAIASEIERQERILEKGEPVHQETRGWDEASGMTKPQRTKEEAADYRYFPEPDIPPIRLTADWIEKIKKQKVKMPEVIHTELVKRGVSEQLAVLISGDRQFSRCYQAVASQSDDVVQVFLKWLQHHKEEAGSADPFDLLDRYKHETVSIVSDETQLIRWVREAVGEHPKAVEDYKSGKQQALQALIGAVQKRAKGKADAKKVSEFLIKQLEP